MQRILLSGLSVTVSDGRGFAKETTYTWPRCLGRFQVGACRKAEDRLAGDFKDFAVEAGSRKRIPDWETLGNCLGQDFPRLGVASSSRSREPKVVMISIFLEK